ncbi:MAG: family transposase [Actinomycetia bacterium]|jgi:hypothetical protein|nr:family transposase [Actinomycetes bacterium]
MFVGWDWASTTHDVTVLDDAGAVVDRWASRHTEQDLAAALDRLARHEDPAGLPVISSAPAGWSSTAWWPLGTRSCPCTHRVLGGPSALGRLRGQVRCRRQLQARRLPAH